MFLKNKFSALLVAILLASTQFVYSQNYELIWADEFDSTEINRDNWTNEVGEYWANNEIQAYTNSRTNSYIDNGVLKIVARNEKYGVRNYTSARMITQAKQSFLYGKIEARIKLPFGQGIWPAFWTLGENISSVSWPKCGEIDIMEMIGGSGRENTVYGTVHWDSDGHASYGGQKTLSTGKFSDDFHVYSIIWDPQKIEWYIDNVKYNVVDITPSHMSEFHKEQFILLNVAVGGSWPGNPDSTTQFPQTMEVDYVRVYQSTSLYPKIIITEPLNNATFATNEEITLTADVDFDDTIEKVQFFQETALIGETSAKPYIVSWKNVEAGFYKISAKAVSNSGLSGSSETIDVTVGNGQTKSPYKGYYVKLPGIIEVENYDICGQGSTFYDVDANNTGGVYRSNSVDIEECTDIGEGYNVGWTAAGEWLTYSINVVKAGNYIFTSRVASEVSTGSYKIEIDGVNKTGNISIASTGSWQTWTNSKSQEVELTEGNHVLKFVVINGNFNINSISVFEKDAVDELNIISPNGGEIWKTGEINEIKWNSQLVHNVRLLYSTNGGATWKAISNKSTAEFGVFRWLIPNDISETCLIAIQNSDKSATYDFSDDNFSIKDASTGIINNNLVHEFSLEQNYPNPFNPTTSISYAIKSASNVKLNIYNMLGQEVATLVNRHQLAGKYSVIFDAKNLSSGTYIYKIVTDEFVSVKKLLLLK